MYGNKRASLAKEIPPPGPIYPRSVVLNEVVGRGGAPLRASSLVWHPLCVFVVLAVCSPPGVRPFLPQSMSAATFSLPSILLLRLVPCLPAGAVVMSILWLVEGAPSSDRWVRWFVVNTNFPPSGCHFRSSQIFGQCFGCHVGVVEEVETQLGDFGCLPSHHHPRSGAPSL